MSVHSQKSSMTLEEAKVNGTWAFHGDTGTVSAGPGWWQLQSPRFRGLEKRQMGKSPGIEEP